MNPFAKKSGEPDADDKGKKKKAPPPLGARGGGIMPAARFRPMKGGKPC